MTTLLMAVLSATATWNPPPPPAPPPDTVPSAEAQLPEEPSRWPGPKTFGLRAGIGGGTATAGVDAGNIGVTWLINDSMALSADLGLGLTATSTGGGANMALSALMAFYLGEPIKSLRIYVPVLFGVGIDSAASGRSTTTVSEGVFQLALGSGIGAEYWLSKHFSFGAELMVRLMLSNFDPLVVHLGTLAPGVRATYYF
jgi:hypothetical protein